MNTQTSPDPILQIPPKEPNEEVADDVIWGKRLR